MSGFSPLGESVTPSIRSPLADGAAPSRPAATTARAASQPETSDQSRAAADMASLRHRASAALSDLDGPAKSGDVQDALLALMPQPMVVLPLPPASADMVTFVAEVTQGIARQAAQARAAMSGVSPAMVEAAASA